MPEVGQKRGTDVDTYGQTDFSKRARESDGVCRFRLLVVGRYAGALIGKGGENFKRLRETYNVKITGLSSQAKERVLQLEGDRENCVHIVKELLPLCPDAPYPAQYQKCNFEINLLVNTDQVGLIVGKGGTKIKEICEHSGGKLEVYQGCLPNSNERVVSLGGDNESQILAALDIISSILVSAHRKTHTTFYNPENSTAPLPSGNPTGIPGQGLPKVNTNAFNVADILISNRDANQRIPRDPNADFALVQTVTTLSVPNDMCGAIIGNAGMNIRQVKMSSGANIEVTRNGPGSTGNRVVTLTGTQEEVQIAEQVIMQFVRDASSSTPTQFVQNASSSTPWRGSNQSAETYFE